MCSDQGRKWGSGQTTSHMESRGSVSFIPAGWGGERDVGGYPLVASTDTPVVREEHCDDTVWATLC